MPGKLTVVVLVAFVLAASIFRFHHDNALETLQPPRKKLPNVTCKVLTRGVFEAGNLVEKVMIKCLVERLPECVNLAVVQAPAEIWVHRATYHNLDAVTVPVYPRALVTGGHAGQLMRSFEGERANETNVHEMGVAES